MNSVYGEEIKGFIDGLATYGTSIFPSTDQIDFDEDISKVKEKLINYRNNLEELHRQQELEMLRLQQGIHITNHVENNQVQVNNISGLTEQAAKEAEKLSGKILTEEDCLKLKEMLTELEQKSDRKGTGEVKNRLCGLVKFAAEKGTEVLIAMLPYLAEMITKMW